MSDYKVEQKKRRRVALVSLGWQLGYGYRKQTRHAEHEAWCVTLDKKIICEASSKKQAAFIAHALNSYADNALEAKAKEIYDSWSSNPNYLPWLDGGNSLMQDEARRIARNTPA